MQAAVTALAGEGKARIARLCIDGKPIATLRSGESAWCWKIAYDESLARFSRECRFFCANELFLLNFPRGLFREIATLACST
jgi:hypothetical protein